MEIPLKHMICTSSYESALGENTNHHQVIRYVCQMTRDNPTLQLCILLMYHDALGEVSTFATYLAHLPRDSFTIPLHWSSEDWVYARQVLPAVLYHRAANTVRSACALYIRLSTTLQSMWRQPKSPSKKYQRWFENAFHWNAFVWSLSIANTRQNAINGGLCLVPVWDMMNASVWTRSADPEPLRTTTAWNPVSQSLEYRAPEALSRGQELLMHYGPRPNEELLVYSGFVLTNNYYDVVAWPLGEAWTAQEEKWRRMVIIQCFKKRRSLVPAPVVSGDLTSRHLAQQRMNTLYDDHCVKALEMALCSPYAVGTAQGDEWSAWYHNELCFLVLLTITLTEINAKPLIELCIRTPPTSVDHLRLNLWPQLSTPITTAVDHWLQAFASANHGTSPLPNAPSAVMVQLHRYHEERHRILSWYHQWLTAALYPLLSE